MKISTPRQQALGYLRDHNVMTLATHGPEGLWAAAVFYVNDEFKLYFLSSPTSRHSLNIAANPLVSATVQEDYRDWLDIKGIQLEGNATRIGGLERTKAMARYGLKFPVVGNMAQAPTEIVRALSRIVWFKVVPSRLYFINNSVGLGHRDVVPL